MDKFLDTNCAKPKLSNDVMNTQSLNDFCCNSSIKYKNSDSVLE